MSVRVDLLKPEEFRYQGAVSRAFAVRVSVIGGGSLLVLLALMALMNGRVVRQQLASARDSWTELKPRYERVSAIQAGLVETAALRDELGGWGRSRIDWHAQLAVLQQLVPSNVQLTELSVKSTLHTLVDESLTEEEAKSVEPTPAREFKFRLEGRTSGEQADKVVVNFVDTLRDNAALRQTLDTIKLQGLQRSGTSQAQSEDRVFGIEATSHLRELK